MNIKEQLIYEIENSIDFKQIKLLIRDGDMKAELIIPFSKEDTLAYIERIDENGMLGEYQITGWEIKGE